MRRELFDSILETEPEVRLDEKMLRLTGTVQSTNLITDRSITLSFALILPDEMFAYYTQGEAFQRPLLSDADGAGTGRIEREK